MTVEQAIVFGLFPLMSYLLGSIPFGFVIGKLKGVDIRTVGSKNIGATNLGRTLGAKFFWYAFLLVTPISYYGFTSYEDFVMNAYFWLLLGILFRLRAVARTPEFLSVEK